MLAVRGFLENRTTSVAVERMGLFSGKWKKVFRSLAFDECLSLGWRVPSLVILFSSLQASGMGQ